MTTDKADFAGATWFKSSHSDENVAECVEVAVLPGRVGVRDSKAHGQGPVLTFPPAQWRAFVTAILTNQFTPR